MDFVGEEFLHKKKKQQRRLYVDHGELQNIFRKMRCMKLVKKEARHYEDLQDKTVIGRVLKYYSFSVLRPAG